MRVSCASPPARMLRRCANACEKLSSTSAARPSRVRIQSALTDNDRESAKLLLVFGGSAIDSISRADVQQYMEARGATAKVRANREKAILSRVWNFARAKGWSPTSPHAKNAQIIFSTIGKSMRRHWLPLPYPLVRNCYQVVG